MGGGRILYPDSASLPEEETLRTEIKQKTEDFDILLDLIMQKIQTVTSREKFSY